MKNIQYQLRYQVWNRVDLQVIKQIQDEIWNQI
jgi:hypothetical protein